MHFSIAPQVQTSTFQPDLAPCFQKGSSFAFTEVSPADVQRAISELSSICGAGPDGIENKFIKIGSHVLAVPLASLFNLSITSCKFPLAWKCVKVTPLHKGGDPENINNYRPISIINSVVKVFEKIIFLQLSNYLADNNLLSQCQSGFRKYFSTTTALLKFTNDVFSSFDNRMCTGALFLDLTKAFDLVDHYLLLDKLYSVGLSTSSLLWFNSYLHNRRQCVSFGGSISHFTGIDRGIPQGSSLGPLLFSIFINDLPRSCTECNIQLYADDTVIYCYKSNIYDISTTLQNGFDSVQQWLLSNKLLLNKSKSYSMLLKKKPNPSFENSLKITFLDQTPVKPTRQVKYLGLWLDSDLSFSTHVHNITNKLNCSLRILYQSINCFNFPVRKRIVTQLLLPILDYVDIVYQNTTASCLQSLNTAYNSLCRFILRCPYRTHHCEMYQLSWLTLPERRRFHWLQFIYKCIYMDYSSYLKQYLIPFSSFYNLRHNYQIYFFVPQINKEIGRYAFQHKAPYEWNNLPISIRSLTSFSKNALAQHLQNTCNCF